jgi:hypothetical protein
MGQIKKDIRSLIKLHGSKANARVEALKWYKSALNTFRNNEVAKYGGRFTPGKIYVFRYETPVTEGLEWWDKNPIVLALDPHAGNEVGINLNLLPVELKETLLDDVHTRLMGQITTSSTRAPENAKAQSGLNLTYDGAKRYLDRYGFGFAVRQYKPNLKGNQAVVSYENWAKIVLCNMMEMQGVTERMVRLMFRKYYNNKNI